MPASRRTDRKRWAERPLPAAAKGLRAALDPQKVPPTLRAPAPAVVPPTSLEPAEAARIAGLRYVNDASPGIRRQVRGRSLRYAWQDGRSVKEPQTLQRIRTLAIPPAWHDVWICPIDNGHIQATGRDARERKQYIYHPDWVLVRDANKFARMQAFGRALGRIRRHVASDLARPGMPREKVLAAVVRLLDTTLIRVGSREYAKQNGSYGLTTLQSRHVDVTGSAIEFEFRGKSGIAHRVVVTEARLARIVRRLLDLPGQELFRYVDADGDVHGIDSSDVNDYLHRVAGEDFSAKDFRTWYATLAAMQALERCECLSLNAGRKEVARVLRDVASRLGNTPAICRKSYVHPRVIECFLAGGLGRNTTGATMTPPQRLFSLLRTRAHASAGTKATIGRTTHR